MSEEAYSVVVIAVSVVSASAVVGHWIGAGLARYLERSISTTTKRGQDHADF
jgi:hypothetical protein